MSEARRRPSEFASKLFVGLVAGVFLTTATACTSKSEPKAKSLVTGSWRAELDTGGGVLPFKFDIRRASAGYAATIRNGDERVIVPVVSVESKKVTFSFPHYDSRIEATLSEDGRALTGTYTKTKKKGAVESLPFRAKAGKAPQFGVHPRSGAKVTTPPPDGITKGFTGRFSARFSETKDPAVGIFEVAPDGTAKGTFLTTTGDYRFLAGNIVDDTLMLSVFDGSHAFLFALKTSAKGLKGDFWSGSKWHETIVAAVDSKAKLPDAFSLTQVAPHSKIKDFPLTDLEGKKTTLFGVAANGKPRIIELFGSWCPNCHDAAAVLSDIDETFKPRGLVVVGLAFEYSGDVPRDIKQVETYRERHDVTYPTLLAGLADKDIAAKLFSGLDKVRAFPTTLFVDHTGALVAVHTGFSGPAAPEAYRATKRAFETNAEALVAKYEASLAVAFDGGAPKEK